MKRRLIQLLIAIVCVLGLFLATGLVASSLVSGSGKQMVVASLASSLGVPITVGEANFDLLQWFMLRPAIAIHDVAIGNPPGYHSRHLLEASKLSAQVALLPLLHKSIEVHSIDIERPRIFAETNAQGISNIEALLKKAKGKPGSGSASSESGSTSVVVDEFSLTSGEIALVETGRAGENFDISGIDIHMQDLASDRPCRLQFAAKFFGGSVSRIRLAAQAGPFTANALPLSGTVSVTIAPAEIPPALRRAQFGDLLAAPGKKAKVSLEAAVRGDVYQRLSGPAKLVLKDILIGKDEKHVLPLAGEAPVTFTASKLMSSPVFQLNVANAQLKLGKGEWLGDAELQLHGTATSGRTSGKVRGVDINELVSSVTAANGKIYGVLEIPSYSLQFAGNNAQQARNSLRGAGKLSVTQGRIAALDLLDKIEHPERLLSNQGDTPFTTLAANLTIGQEKMNLDGIALDSPVLRVTGQGYIGFDQAINFALAAHVSGGVSTMVSRTGVGGQTGGIPLTVTGTVESPQVRPAVGKMVESVAGGLLDSLLKKKSK
jgi:uncharacterized protein involved in outer membrane biogenesis